MIQHETLTPSPVDQLALASARKGLRGGNASSFSAEELSDLRLILDNKYEYMDAEVFHQPRRQAMKAIFKDAPAIDKPDTSWYHPVMDAGLAAKRKSRTVGSVLLSAEQERALFLQFNYCRFRICETRDILLSGGTLTPKRAEDILHWYGKARAYRDQIAQTNLALVLAMAKRTRMSEVDFGDLVSEGNMALLRAVDKFDAGRGFKFSTYACRAILKAFSRAGMKLSKYRSVFPATFDPEFERSDYQEVKNATHEEDCADEVKRIVEENGAELTRIEQQVILHRFSLTAPEVRDDPAPPVMRTDGKRLTLQQVGQIVGVTKERVRQIQNRAMDKIRVQLEQGYLA